jgi:hypothetical protein
VIYIYIYMSWSLSRLNPFKSYEKKGDKYYLKGDKFSDDDYDLLKKARYHMNEIENYIKYRLTKTKLYKMCPPAYQEKLLKLLLKKILNDIASNSLKCYFGVRISYSYYKLKNTLKLYDDYLKKESNKKIKELNERKDRLNDVLNDVSIGLNKTFNSEKASKTINASKTICMGFEKKFKAYLTCVCDKIDKIDNEKLIADNINDILSINLLDYVQYKIFYSKIFILFKILLFKLEREFSPDKKYLKCLKKLIYEAIFTYLKPRNEINVPDNIFQKKLKQLDTPTTYALLIELNEVLFKEIKDNPTPQIVSDITKYVIDTHRTYEDKNLFENLFLYALKLNKTDKEPDELTKTIENIIRSNTELSELLEKYKFVTNNKNISKDEIKMIQLNPILLISILISQLIKLSTEITNSEEEIMNSEQEPDELLDDYIEEQTKTQKEIMNSEQEPDELLDDIEEQTKTQKEIMNSEQEPDELLDDYIEEQTKTKKEIIELLQLDKLNLEILKIDDEENNKFIDQQFDDYIGAQISDDDINECAVNYLSSVDITEGGKRIRKQKTIRKRKQKTIRKKKQKTIRKKKQKTIRKRKN